MKYRIVEEYDGRLPEYLVLDENNKVIDTFDSMEGAQIWIDQQNIPLE